MFNPPLLKGSASQFEDAELASISSQQYSQEWGLNDNLNPSNPNNSSTTPPVLPPGGGYLLQGDGGIDIANKIARSLVDGGSGTIPGRDGSSEGSSPSLVSSHSNNNLSTAVTTPPGKPPFSKTSMGGGGRATTPVTSALNGLLGAAVRLSQDDDEDDQMPQPHQAQHQAQHRPQHQQQLIPPHPHIIHSNGNGNGNGNGNVGVYGWDSDNDDDSDSDFDSRPGGGDYSPGRPMPVSKEFEDASRRISSTKNKEKDGTTVPVPGNTSRRSRRSVNFTSSSKSRSSPSKAKPQPQSKPGRSGKDKKMSLNGTTSNSYEIIQNNLSAGMQGTAVEQCLRDEKAKKQVSTVSSQPYEGSNRIWPLTLCFHGRFLSFPSSSCTWH